MWWIYPVYMLDLIAMVYLSMKLGDFVDLLDKKTKISGAFIGGVLLAAVTSLPELFTSISSVVMVRNPELVVGDILGSTVFDLVVLAIETLMFVKNFSSAKIAKWHSINCAALLLMYGFCAYAFFVPEQYQVMLGSINLMSILITVLYILTLVFQPKESDGEEKGQDDSKMTLKTLILLFIISSILLIAASIGLTYLTDMIQDQIPALTGSVAGALLLGIGTSVPEIISTFQLFRKKNYDAGYGNMIGSCTFDMFILCFGDFISWKGMFSDEGIAQAISTRGIFFSTVDSKQFEIAGIVVTALTLMICLFKSFSHLFEKKGFNITMNSLYAALCTAAYILVYAL